MLVLQSFSMILNWASFGPIITSELITVCLWLLRNSSLCMETRQKSMIKKLLSTFTILCNTSLQLKEISVVRKKKKRKKIIISICVHVWWTKKIGDQICSFMYCMKLLRLFLLSSPFYICFNFHIPLKVWVQTTYALRRCKLWVRM